MSEDNHPDFMIDVHAGAKKMLQLADSFVGQFMEIVTLCHEQRGEGKTRFLLGS
jgi:hypothetical protein